MNPRVAVASSPKVIAWDYTHRVDFAAHCPPEWNLLPCAVLEDFGGSFRRLASVPFVTNEQASAWARSLNAWQRLRQPTLAELEAGRGGMAVRAREY